MNAIYVLALFSLGLLVAVLAAQVIATWQSRKNIGKRCGYAIPVVVLEKRTIYTRCVKRHIGPVHPSMGLHMAKFPDEVVTGHRNAFICWRSSNGPDYDVATLSWGAEIQE